MQYTIASRQSKLAIAQTDYIINEMKKKADITFDKLLIKTLGDKRLEVTLDKIGGKGVFVKDIEIALLKKEAHGAVHSMKDVPSQLDERFEIAGIPTREDVRDVFISRDGRTFQDLPRGAKIGSSSKRRVAQIKALRPDIEVVPIRGNILTRIEKIEREDLDGIVLAYAGLKRLGLEDQVSSIFSIEEVVPAVGQGALGVEVVKGSEITDHIKLIDNREVRLCVEAERSFMKALNGGCHIAIGAYASIDKEYMNIIGIFEIDGKLIKKEIDGKVEEHIKLGQDLAKKILNEH